MEIRGHIAIIKRALSVLGISDRRKIYLICIIQSAMSLMDMLGIALIGLVASLSLFGIQSKNLPDSIAEVLQTLRLDSLGFQSQVAVLGLAAAALLVIKTAASVFISRRILYFLNLKTALVTTDLLKKALSRPHDYVKSKSTSVLLFSTTRGVESLLSGVVGSASIIISEGFLLLVVFIGVSIFDPVITAFALLYFFIISFIQGKRMNLPAQVAQSESAKELMASESQILQAMELYREFLVRNAIDSYMFRLKQSRERMANLKSRVQFLPYIAKYSMEISLVCGAILLASFQFITKDAISALATLSVFLAAAMRVSPSILRLQQALLNFRAKTGDAQATLDLMDELDQHQEVSLDLKIPGREFSDVAIQFQNVAFKFLDSDKLSLKSVNFEILRGSFTAIVGPSGAGKSTILDLMMGALWPTSGEVILEGRSPSIFMKQFPGHIGYVAQESVFYNASLRENLLLGLNPDAFQDDLLWAALQRVGLVPSSGLFPEGLESSLGGKSNKLSVGQRQRLSLARALVTSPRYLFLDEPTSSLDRESELLISNLINSLRGDKTIVVIAHRLETIKNADSIIYVESGKIKRIGSYEHIFGPKS